MDDKFLYKTQEGKVSWEIQRLADGRVEFVGPRIEKFGRFPLYLRQFVPKGQGIRRLKRRGEKDRSRWITTRRGMIKRLLSQLRVCTSCGKAFRSYAKRRVCIRCWNSLQKSKHQSHKLVQVRSSYRLMMTRYNEGRRWGG